MKIVDVRKLRRRIAIYNYFVWRERVALHP